MLNLSFSDFFKTRSWLMKEMAIMEMAKAAENVAKAKVLMDQDDLDFLHQFPTHCPKYKDDNLWMLALRWRYSEGLLQVAKFWEEDLGRTKEDPGPVYDKDLQEQFPNVQTVHLVKWSGGRSRKGGVAKGAIDVEEEDRDEAGISKIQRIYEFPGIKTEAVKLWEKLQDPEGAFNFDLTMAYDWANQERDALHQFNRTAGALQQEAADRNLRAWLLANHHDVIKPQGGAAKVNIDFGSTTYNLQGTKLKFPRYKVYVFGGGKGRPVTDPAKLKAMAASQRSASEYGLSNFAGAITGMVQKVVEVPESEEVVPILAGGTLLEPIPTNKKDILLPILGFQEPFPSLSKLVGMYLIDPTDSHPQGGRTADNLIRTIEPHLEELDLGKAWWEKIKEYLKEAEDAVSSRSAEFKKKRGRASASPEEVKKRMANLNLGNLVIVMNPKFTQNAWRNPAGTDPNNPFRFTAEEDIANAISNWELLSDKSKQILKSSPAGDDLFRIQRAMQRGEISPNRYWTLGGWDLSKAEFQSIGQSEFDKIFNKEEQTVLIYRNAEATFRRIQSCSSPGAKIGNRPLSNQEVEICNQEASVARRGGTYQDSELAFEIAQKAVLTPLIMYELEQAGYDAKDPRSDASRTATSEVAAKFIAGNRINALLGARLKAMTRVKTVSADAISAAKGKSGGGEEGMSIASILDTGAGTGSGTSAAGKLHRRLTAGEGGTGREERGSQKAKEKDIKFLMANKQAAIDLRKRIVGEKGESESQRNIKKLMKLDPVLKRRAFTFQSQELDEIISLMEQGISEEELIKQFVGEMADASTIVAANVELVDAESLDDYKPEPENTSQKPTAELEVQLRTLDQKLIIDLMGKTINLRDEVTKAFDELKDKGEQIIEHRLAKYLQLIKEYFRGQGFPLDLFEKRWESIVSQVRDLIENKGKLPTPAPVPEPERPRVAGGSLKSFLQRKKPEGEQGTTSATPTAPTPSPIATDPARAEWRDKQAATVKRIHALLGSKSPQLTAIARNPTQVNLISGLRKHLSVSHPDQVKQVDDILKYFAAQGIKVETSVVMGYPPYTNIKKALKLSKINAWGAPGADYVATPDEGPIMQKKKKKSLKEYLDTKTNEHALYQDCMKRLRERVNGK